MKQKGRHKKTQKTWPRVIMIMLAPYIPLDHISDLSQKANNNWVPFNSCFSVTFSHKNFPKGKQWTAFNYQKSWLQGSFLISERKFELWYPFKTSNHITYICWQHLIGVCKLITNKKSNLYILSWLFCKW